MRVHVRIDSQAIKEAINFVRLIYEIGNSANSQRHPVNSEVSLYNPYKVLGISPRATDEEVKSRYRKLSKIWHPDMKGGDGEAMKRLNLAYDEIWEQRQIKP